MTPLEKKQERQIEKQKELIIILTKALDFLADNNLIKERKDNNDTDNKPLIDCVNRSAELKSEIAALEQMDKEEMSVMTEDEINSSMLFRIRDEMDSDMEESGMAQGEIESCLNHWSNKYIIWKREWINSPVSVESDDATNEIVEQYFQPDINQPFFGNSGAKPVVKMPSDEEIFIESKKHAAPVNFECGAKWFKSQIQK